jgi:chromosome segregation ATPase
VLFAAIIISAPFRHLQYSQTEAARTEAAALQATLSQRDVTITAMTSEATSAAAKLQSVEEQLCDVEQRAAAATVAHDTAVESAAVQIKQGLQQLSEQADTVKVYLCSVCSAAVVLFLWCCLCAQLV